ncbi:MAG: hypothetical protein EWV82_03190 [Microcystis aeruginosa Ma_AC_P_19900807_S299]|nr:MAG: hypothetical protein EWV82_03190 [Microcystis aeruginosa Ma_AC_P_19900807_S299]
MAIEINPSTPSIPIPTVNGISVIWLGDWDNARIYRRNEGVFYDGSSYRANKTTSEEPNPTALDWDLIAQGTNVDTSTIINNHIANTSNPHSTTAAQVGAIPTTEKGIASGVATLDSGGKIPDTQIPDAITRDSELTNYYNKTETDSLLNTKANVSTTYSKSETNTLLAAKANQSTTYTKTETDGLLNAKANQSTTYTKIETDSLLNTKANQATTYSKTETDTLLNAKANQTTTYTKTETDGLLASKANQSTTYTKTEVDTLVNARPDNLIELGDVVITSPIDGQSLVYDDSTGKWINETISGGGGGSGEANTATNVGTAGVGIINRKLESI